MRIHPRRAQVDPSNPQAWATDDRTGFVGNHKDLKWQFDWRGNGLQNLRILTYDPDQPQRQLGTIVLPPDPMPIMNARPENYAIDEVPVSTRYTLDGRIRVTLPAPVLASIRIISGDTTS